METKNQPENLAGAFLEIARQHHAKRENGKYIQWCARCGKDTEHTCEDRGIYEVYTCSCGCVHSIAVR